MKLVIRLSVSFVLAACGSLAFAAPYSWIAYTGTSSYFGDTISEACTKAAAGFQNRPGVPSTTKYTFTSTYHESNNVWTCVIRKDYVNPSGPGSQDVKVSVYRSGDSCPNPEDTFNQQTGNCDQPPSSCQSKEGSSFAFMATPPDGQLSLPGEYICDSGCRATWNTGANGTCANNDQGIRACFGIGTYTGTDCQTGDIPTGTSTPPPDPTDPVNPPDPVDPPDPTDPSDPCGGMPGYSWSGTACVPSNPTDPSNPGDTDTGGGNSGGGNSGGNDGSGGGNVGGIGGGDNDGGNGDGSGSGDGDGNGNGSGNGNSGEGDDGEGDNEEGNASVSGESCTAELACEGDVIQCAILRKNKEQVCQWKYDSEAQGQVESALSGPEYQLQDQDIPVSGLFNDALNKGRWLPQSCPAPQTFSVKGRSYSFSWEPACRFALAIGPLIVALASIFFAVTIARGIKGS